MAAAFVDYYIMFDLERSMTEKEIKKRWQSGPTC